MIRFKGGADRSNVATVITGVEEIANELRPTVTSYKHVGKEGGIGSRTDPLIIYTNRNPGDTVFEPLHNYLLDHQDYISNEDDIPFYEKAPFAPFYFGKQPTEELKGQKIESFGSIFTTATAQAIADFAQFPFMEVDTDIFKDTIQAKPKTASSAHDDH